MVDDGCQQRDTNVSKEKCEPSLSFAQVMLVLIQLHRLREHEVGKLAARVKKVQRAGLPIGVNVGRGPRVRYSLDQLFQLIMVLELSELSISIPTASNIVRDAWPVSLVSLAPADAWRLSEQGKPETVIILASASDIEGVRKHRSESAAATARAAESVMGASRRPADIFAQTTANHIFKDGRLDLSQFGLSGNAWRVSLIDMSVLTARVMEILQKNDLVAADEFTQWAHHQIETFDARFDAHLKRLHSPPVFPSKPAASAK